MKGRLFLLIFFTACGAAMEAPQETTTIEEPAEIQVFLDTVYNKTNYSIALEGRFIKPLQTLQLRKKISFEEYHPGKIPIMIGQAKAQTRLTHSSGMTEEKTLVLTIGFNEANRILNIVLRNDIKNKVKERYISFVADEVYKQNIDLTKYIARGANIHLNLTIEGVNFENSRLEYRIARIEALTLLQESLLATVQKIRTGEMTLEQAKRIIPTDLHEVLEQELKRKKIRM